MTAEAVPAERARSPRRWVPTCRCGAPSEWIAGLDGFCEPCLPASAVFWLLRGRLSRRIDEAFRDLGRALAGTADTPAAVLAESIRAAVRGD